jgi:hypothetical protein
VVLAMIISGSAGLGTVVEVVVVELVVVVVDVVEVLVLLQPETNPISPTDRTRTNKTSRNLPIIFIFLPPDFSVM